MVGERIRVIIADDHARVRGQIRAALEDGGCEVCAEGASADEAIVLALEHRPDVVLLDIHMPGNGIYAAGRINLELGDTAVVMLTQSKEDDDLFDSLRAGASGYLLKDTDPAKLPDALRSVLAGDSAISPGLVTRILAEFRGPARRHLRRSAAAARLSAREWEVMELLGQGESTDQVAKRLFVSPTTVRVHVSSVLRKLVVPDRDSAFKLLRND
ncbi:response regulator transcription factor [Cryobacterium sp. TMT1-21]|uniref:Response regulator transcription factor n=1 Tax=Cryobacterium shii TaxID=1259235 RepID=A0AAQ2C5B0_9MICO|nr:MULTISPECIES: response regulator transcription factor [Cryobacterium]TFC44335.1 response regulator transcription factor [Cryobacterium shii]TFC88405.1 response regulator transcription factor [Cryobacterium sp. TmT2-59]TFD17885.1 response regulator transcription factor [Cryobacterium sp. TMT1-21]TFD18015.1 response regulator transcription factor [Cryobacterium sp. TMT2-23]TFD20911.1 response regulator transcription factor [Cryobacterium sp. TMT4-10]